MSHSSDEGVGDEENADGLTTSEQFELLRSERRRQVMDALHDEAEPLALEALAARIAEDETDSESDETVHSVSISLHHLHLPKMDEMGVLDYDAEAHRIESFNVR